MNYSVKELFIITGISELEHKKLKNLNLLLLVMNVRTVGKRLTRTIPENLWSLNMMNGKIGSFNLKRISYRNGTGTDKLRSN